MIERMPEGYSTIRLTRHDGVVNVLHEARLLGIYQGRLLFEVTESVQGEVRVSQLNGVAVSDVARAEVGVSEDGNSATLEALHQRGQLDPDGNLLPPLN